MNDQPLIESTQELRAMSDGAPQVRREFLLKQIEHEIDAGFAFVSAARLAYNQLRTADGDLAVEDALSSQERALKHLADSEISQVRAVTHQLAELRQAIEWLRESLVDEMGNGD